MLEALYIFMIDETLEADEKYFGEIIAPKIEEMKKDFFRQNTIIVLPEADTALRKSFTDKIKSITKGCFPALYSYSLKDYSLSRLRRVADVYHFFLDEKLTKNYEIRLVTFIKNKDSEAFRQTEEFRKEAEEVIALI